MTDIIPEDLLNNTSFIYKCSNCSRVLESPIEPHICPFADDVHENIIDLCTCCSTCTLSCADEI